MLRSHTAGSTNSTELDLAPSDAFALITDATSYPEWLVGAKKITTIDDDWPAVGTSFEHRIGFGPLHIPGSTSVREIESPNRLVLGAGMGPLGEVRVEFDLEPVESATRVTVHEVPSRGIARLAWFVGRPLVAAGLWGRNQTSLVELEAVARKRRSSTLPG